MKRAVTRLGLGGALLGLVLAAYACTAGRAEHGADAGKAVVPPTAADRSLVAFMEAYPVFMSPRCVNCHPAGDAPLQGDDSHVHEQNVKRGPHGDGLYALKCSSCHQGANLPGENMPPGNPTWRLPPPEMPMVFQGRTPGQLARQLADPGQNGGKTLEQLLEHVEHDKLVLGGWDPGDGRKPPPVTHAHFARAMREWIEGGAPAPNP